MGSDPFSAENGSDPISRAYARHLLASLGLPATASLNLPDEHPARSWARSGLMHLTGRRDGSPQMCPVPIASCADGALAALASLAPGSPLEGWRGSQLLAERAAFTGWSRAGASSPSGSCRLLEAADGWMALNLPREDDWTLLPAWLEVEGSDDWDRVAQAVRFRSARELVERGRLMGLAVALDAPSPRRKPGSSVFKTLDAGFRRHDRKKPLVVDLSSLWAGPLCTHLLQQLGAEVIKVESASRPDGARQGPSTFFDLLNAGKASVALDFQSRHGRRQLRALLAKADIVVEGSRPRALRQLGIEAEALLREKPGLTWISITGYGRAPATENWIAYGDDAAVAGGLSHATHAATGERLICGDAIADPLTGLHAALAAWAGFRQGGGRLRSIALADVVGHCVTFARPAVPAGPADAAALPQARTPAGLARPLGADTAAVLGDLGIAA
jgi:hypothetical protein